MIPATYNLPTGYRGDTYGPLTFYFNDASGNAISLDGGSGLLQLKSKRSDCPALEWNSNDNSMQISGNQLVLTAKSGWQMEIPAQTYQYDLQVYQSGITTTYIMGDFTLYPDITNN
jgi:hypothetical protein